MTEDVFSDSTRPRGTAQGFMRKVSISLIFGLRGYTYCYAKAYPPRKKHLGSSHLTCLQRTHHPCFVLTPATELHDLPHSL
eukprot:26775-Hanusia_phi.AAC.1